MVPARRSRTQIIEIHLVPAQSQLSPSSVPGHYHSLQAFITELDYYCGCISVVCFVLSRLIRNCVPAELYPASPPDLSSLSSELSPQPWRHSVTGWEQHSQHSQHRALPGQPQLQLTHWHCDPPGATRVSRKYHYYYFFLPPTPTPPPASDQLSVI